MITDTQTYIHTDRQYKVNCKGVASLISVGNLQRLLSFYEHTISLFIIYLSTCIMLFSNLLKQNGREDNLPIFAFPPLVQTAHKEPRA